MLEQGDFVVARCVLVVPRHDQLDGVGAGRRGLAAEAFGTAPEPAEPGPLLPAGIQNADRHVDGDLVDLAQDEVVLACLERVASGVAGGERAGQRAAAAQFGGLRGEVAGGDEERERGEEGGGVDGAGE